MSQFDEKTEILGGGDPRRQPMLGRYRLERRIGSGGMAEIFLARAAGPAGFEKQVVIKRIRPALAGNERFVEMFLREARALAALDHPNIVRIFELDEQAGEYFLALEYLEGLSLRELVERFWHQGRPVPIEPIIRVIADAALGLEYAHNFKDLSGVSARLVHRDVSPDNLFLTTAGVTKVLDFGIAKNEGEALTQQGELKGKIPFMSPEQLKGEELDGRTDLWSAGVSLYWLLAGRRPFDGVTDVHTMKSILEDAPQPLRLLNPRVPTSLDAVVSACLEKDRDRRMSSAAALHDALMTLLVGLPRGWPAPDIVVGQAMAMPAIEHEGPAASPPAVNVVPWSDRGQGAVRLPDVSAADDTRANPRAVIDDNPDSLNPATEVIQSVNVSTDEHRRAEAPPKSGEGSFLVNSDPILPRFDAALSEPARLKIETLQAPVDPSAPTLQQMPRPDFSDVPPPTTRPPEVAPGEDFFQKETALVARPAVAPQGSVADPPSHTLAVAAGMVAVLIAIGGALFFTGVLDELWRERVLVHLAALDDAGSDDAGEEDAGALAAVDDAGSETVVAAADAGAPVVVDAGAQLVVDAGPQPRTLRLSAPSSVSWIVGGSRIERGGGEVTLPPGTQEIMAYDAVRNVRTTVPIGDAAVIDYDKLPKGKLAVRARPYADVYLGKTRLGRTPIGGESVIAGTYNVKLVYKRKRKIVEVEVRPGEQAVVKYNFR